MDTLSARLKEYRRFHKWTQQDLADRSGVALVTIRRIEQGEFEPRLETVRRLAATLRARAGWLAFGEPPQENRFMDDGDGLVMSNPTDEGGQE